MIKYNCQEGEEETQTGIFLPMLVLLFPLVWPNQQYQQQRQLNACIISRRDMMKEVLYSMILILTQFFTETYRRATVTTPVQNTQQYHNAANVQQQEKSAVKTTKYINDGITRPFGRRQITARGSSNHVTDDPLLGQEGKGEGDERSQQGRRRRCVARRARTEKTTTHIKSMILDSSKSIKTALAKYTDKAGSTIGSLKGSAHTTQTPRYGWTSSLQTEQQTPTGTAEHAELDKISKAHLAHNGRPPDRQCSNIL